MPAVVRMPLLTTLIYSAVLAAARSSEELSFPPGFKFGVASAAYQVEGAWNASDKGESIWDRFTHRSPSPVADGSTGDVACDSYHLWKEDVNMVAELGVHFYRISISWPRILPTGFANRISADGARYYSELIDGLLEKGIEPVITLYHWDLPQSLQDLGGWTNALIADWFADYARVTYSLYADRVKTWVTINEAWGICDLPGSYAPGIISQTGFYICSKNILMAHAKAWRIYDQEYRPKYHGVLSIANHAMWIEGMDEAEEETVQLVREYQEGRFSHAIFSKEGGWPPVVEKAIAGYSEKEGYPWSMLPTLTKNEIEFIKGTYDFYALNFYASRQVRRSRPGEELEPWPLGDAPHLGVKMRMHPDWPVILKVFPFYPEGLRKQLSWLNNQYGDIPILITESGRGTLGGLDDQDTIYYHRDYLKQVLLSIKEDGVNVTGYTVWSIMDNFEWSSGYNTKFGLYEVDFSSPRRSRTPRASAQYYASVVRTHSLEVPDNYTTHTRVAPKSSKPQDNTQYIIFGGVILVIVLAVIAAIVGCRLKRRARMEKKHRYTAVARDIANSDQNGTQSGDRNGTQNGDRNGTQNDDRNINQNAVQNSNQNGGQNSDRNDTIASVDESRIPLKSLCSKSV